MEADSSRWHEVTPSSFAHERAALEQPIDLDTAVVPGAWRVQIARSDLTLREEPRSAFVVAPPVAESDLAPTAATGASPASAGFSPATSGTATAVRYPLSPWLFALFGALALLEGGLRLTRRRPA